MESQIEQNEQMMSSRIDQNEQFERNGKLVHCLKISYYSHNTPLDRVRARGVKLVRAAVKCLK